MGSRTVQKENRKDKMVQKPDNNDRTNKLATFVYST